MTTTRTNADTVTAIYAAFGRGDVPAILDALADDVGWEQWRHPTTAQRAGVPHLAARRCREEVLGFVRALGEWTVEEFRVLDVIGTGRQVAAEISTTLSRPDGARLADEEMHLWTFDDAGRAVRFRHYCDTGRHLAAWRGEDTASPDGQSRRAP